MEYNSTTIRPARIDEHRQLTTLALRAKAYWGYDADFIKACELEMTITEDYLNRAPCMIVEDKGRQQGFYGLSRSGNEAELLHFWIDPDFIGKGLGRILWNHAVVHAKSLGWKRLKIVADPNSRDFYVRMGAVIVDSITSPISAARKIPVLSYEL